MGTHPFRGRFCFWGDAVANRRITPKQAKFVAAYIGPANGNATEAARQAGYRGNDATLGAVGNENLKKPLIASAIDAWRNRIEKRAIADLQARVDGYDLRRSSLLQIVTERASHRDYAKVPGGRTGWLVRTIKQIGGGETAQVVEEYAFDSGLHRELRELEKQAAQDLGQWQEHGTLEITIQRLADRVAEDMNLASADVLAEADRILAASGMVD